MGKILRLQAVGDNTLQGWQDSTKYSTSAIDQIADPNGGSASKQITSIPSPFARIELVKTAFKIVSEKDVNGRYINIDGTTTYNEMVSHTLDVGQIFFEHDVWKDSVEILVWDKKADLNKLLNSTNPAHRQLGETYALYLKQDSSTYNFDKLNRIYLLNYKRGNSPTVIIGATSPATLFFSSANDFSDQVNDIFFGADRPFDKSYMPLYKRDIEYHKYWRLLQISIPNFSSLYPEVNSYLDACFTMSDSERQAVLRALQPGDLAAYSDLTVNTAGNNVEVLGFPLKKLSRSQESIANSSDFVISSRIATDKPLVLPVETFTQSHKYTTAIWDRNTKVPYKDSSSICDRILPQDGNRYPYLTISDFLEDSIVMLPNQSNARAFFNGNLIVSGENIGVHYLLPLKTLFFKYFTAEDLMGNVVPNGPKMIEMKKLASGIKVTLRIPIVKGFIEYQRMYFEDQAPVIDSTHNDGAVRKADFAFAMFSNVKFNEDKYAAYRLGLITRYDEKDSISMNCYKGADLVPGHKIVRNDVSPNIPCCQTLAIDSATFDYVQLVAGSYSAVILPVFKKENGTEQFTFAIDFGTTNTHVEYSVNGEPSVPFNINENDVQMQHLGDYDLIREYIYDADFLPKFIGTDKCEFKFPIRTVLSAGKNTNWKQRVVPMGHANIPMTYERRSEYIYNRTLTNLKWSNDPDNVCRIQSYIESLFMLIRNKVILNNGNVQATKIIWFYPISMTRNRYVLFKEQWEAAYRKYFSDNVENITSMTESVAPYQFFKGQYGQANIVSIDVGGGTSDVVIADRGEVQYITSFRFAANSIFGDAYANLGGSVQNGMIRQFIGKIKESLKQNNMTDLLKFIQTLEERNDSSDLASFFFSLNKNKKIEEKGFNEDVNFHRLLQLDENQKIVFLIFYSALIYHVAKLMKAKNLAMPRFITFSGNGSKVISILSSDNELLATYTKLIFAKVYGTSYAADGLSIKYDDKNPKEVTCKGGIICAESEGYDAIAPKKVVLKGSDCSTFINGETYQTITDATISSTVEEVRKFFNLIFSLPVEFNMRDNFGINHSTFDLAKEVCLKDLDVITRNGLDEKRKEVADQDVIEETMFFYPLVGVLNTLAGVIYEDQLR